MDHRRAQAVLAAPLRLVLLILWGGFALLVCGDDTTTVPPDPETLFAPGPHPVGYRRTSLTYTRAVTGENRTLPLSIWYPAAPSENTTFAVYTTAALWPIRTETAYASAPIAVSGDPYPVVVYSHGGGGEAQHAYPYGELLASHGFVVISPAHMGTTLFDIGDGFDSIARWAIDRPNDISAALDWLEIPTTDTEFENMTTTEGVMVLGYSIGGYTGFAVAGLAMDPIVLCELREQSCELFNDPAVVAAIDNGLSDPRISALVAQAPAVEKAAIDGDLTALDIPIMLQSGRLDETTTRETFVLPTWNRSNGEHDIWIDMPTGAHLSFIPTCEDLPVFVVALAVPNAVDDGCSESFIPPAEAMAGLGAYALGFARVHLLGETQWEPVLRGPALRSGFEITTR